MTKRSAPRGQVAEAGPSAEGEQDRLAVLIDADNAHAAVIDGLLAEIARYGIASVKRIYGDWTQPQLGSWKKVLLEHSIVPVQQFAYTKGKNATDSALIIDAMDLMYTRRFDGFCLVSSDSDFTRLASRLREEGLLVYGFGERKTPSPFVSACDRFVYTEVLRPTGAAGKPGASEKRPAKAGTSEVAAAPPAAVAVPAPGEQPAAEPAPIAGEDPGALLDTIANAIDAVSDETGWAGLGAVGRTITKLRPDFDSRLYGHRKFSDLVRAMPERFELEERGTGAGKSLFVRLAPRPAKGGRGRAGGRKRKAAA
ncbi:NYN domain-containing protein [Burkholderiaceae bacterium FT117]|uniref:NYN domain-containing protein n=1 Tax=Zeimonas sediminis TaxID=2944268 RepID=UPI0023430C6B|nr:NYN domain-containing protein [Zeimonas sediminis]MCM5571167.1 NYN domain-containing protein [Zeimonas sediminis]